MEGTLPFSHSPTAICYATRGESFCVPSDSTQKKRHRWFAIGAIETVYVERCVQKSYF